MYTQGNITRLKNVHETSFVEYVKYRASAINVQSLKMISPSPQHFIAYCFYFDQFLFKIQLKKQSFLKSVYITMFSRSTSQ